MSIATIEDIKTNAKLLDYGDNRNSKQITDSEIETTLLLVTKQVITWLSGLEFDTKVLNYYVKRYITLETIVVLCLSNYSDTKKDYIESIKLERDKYFELIEKNTRRFMGGIKRIKQPQYLGNLYE